MRYNLSTKQIKWLVWPILLILCYFIGTSNAFAVEFWDYGQNFDSYEVGTFDIENWGSNYAQISDTYSESPPNSLNTNTSSSIGNILYHFTPSMRDVEFAFDFYIPYASSGGGYNYVYLYNDYSSNEPPTGWVWRYGLRSYNHTCFWSTGSGVYNTISCNAWHTVYIKTDRASGLYYYELDGGITSGWVSLRDNNTWSLVGWRTDPYDLYIEDFYFFSAPPASGLNILSPENGTSTISNFDLEFDYNLEEENYDKLYIIFESWDASSTCPEVGTEEYQTEYSNGWFKNRSSIYFSDFLSGSGTSTMAISNLDIGEYNCIKCYFWNSENHTTNGENKCPDYNLNIIEYLSEGIPITSWSSYYAEHSDEKFATSTEIFDTIASTFSGLIDKLTYFSENFKSIFDTNSAYTKGQSYGQAIPTIRGYIKPINDFFGGFPVSEIFIFILIIYLVVIVYRIVIRILNLIKFH